MNAESTSTSTGVLAGIDANLSAEEVLKRALQAHASHRFREFVIAVQQCINTHGNDSKTSSSVSKSVMSFVDEKDEEDDHVIKAVAGAGDRILETKSHEHSCRVLVAGNSYTYACLF